ncbi:MAG: hypothetical protein ACRDY4_14740 [Acidimicrobiia bacterium]
MAVEEHSLRIRRSLEETLGVEEAAYVIEGRPPGGWGSLVTKEYLDLRLGTLEERVAGFEERSSLRIEAFEERVGRRFAELDSSVDRRLRAQTWIMTGTLLTGLGIALSLGQAL